MSGECHKCGEHCLECRCKCDCYKGAPLECKCNYCVTQRSTRNNGWVSIKDRLPKNEERVLCCMEKQISLATFYLEYEEQFYSSKSGFYKKKFTNCFVYSICDFLTVKNTQYWQQLPKPPKIESPHSADENEKEG